MPDSFLLLVDGVSQLLLSDGIDLLLLKQTGSSPGAVASLPAAGNQGRRHFVTNATATTFASIVVGGGANPVPVYDDGTNWRIG